MKFSRFHCIIVIIICITLFPCLLAKPFSLNEAIAAEKAIASANKTAKNTEKIAERIFLNEAVTSAPSKYKKPKKTKKLTGVLKAQTKRISPLKYRKLFQIDIPLKPKRLHIQKPLLRRRNQAQKRDANLNERFSNKYVPLLRNLGLFFNRLLSSTESDDDRDSNDKDKYYTDGTEDDNACPCSHRTKIVQKKETTTPTSDPLSETSDYEQDQAEAATATTHNIAPRNISRIRQNPNVPLLLTRDPSSRESDDNGVGARSRAPLHRSTTRNITRYYGDSEHDTGREGNNADTAFHDETTPGVARDSTSGRGTDRGDSGNGRDTGSPGDREGVDATDGATEAAIATREAGGNLKALEDEDQLEVGGNETEHPQPIRGRLRRPLPEHQVGDIGESIQPREDHEESLLDVREHITSDQPVSERDGPVPTEDQILRTTDEAMILRSGSLVYEESPKDRKIVRIFDGYSVARGKYGDNKIATKAISIK